MQVKKFEARSMKEALEMVKSQLGPDAIILGVRDNKKSFGLVGEGSIEITAAVSEETLQRKKFAESRMREQEKQKMMLKPARAQKEFINRSVENYQREQDKETPKAITRTRYIEIADEIDGLSATEPQSTERIRGAAQRAWNAMNSNQEWLSGSQVVKPHHETPKNTATMQAPSGGSSQNEIQALRGEIATLKQVIKQFQTVPQNLTGNSPLLTQHPGAEFGLGYEMSQIFEKLTNAGIATDIAAEILTLAQAKMPAIKTKSKALVDAWVAKYILDTTKVTGDKNPGKVHLF